MTTSSFTPISCSWDAVSFSLPRYLLQTDGGNGNGNEHGHVEYQCAKGSVCASPGHLGHPCCD